MSTVRELFDFVIDLVINDDNMEVVFEVLSEFVEEYVVEFKCVNV